MTLEELEKLGISKEDLLERLVDSLCYMDAERFHETVDATLQQETQKQVKATIDRKIDDAMEQHVLPKVSQMVDDICLQETTKWGEKKGEPLSFVEYLVARVDHYIREKVDHRGESKEESRSSFSSFHAKGTRIEYMIHKHLQYQIETAMKKALGEVNSSVRKGLQEAVNVALSNIDVKVSTEVTKT